MSSQRASVSTGRHYVRPVLVAVTVTTSAELRPPITFGFGQWRLRKKLHELDIRNTRWQSRSNRRTAHSTYTHTAKRRASQGMVGTRRQEGKGGRYSLLAVWQVRQQSASSTRLPVRSPMWYEYSSDTYAELMLPRSMKKQQMLTVKYCTVHLKNSAIYTYSRMADFMDTVYGQQQKRHNKSNNIMYTVSRKTSPKFLAVGLTRESVVRFS